MKNGTLSLEMDIYSYGILLYELLHQQKMQKLVGVDDDEEKVVANLRTSIEKYGNETAKYRAKITLACRSILIERKLFWS